MIAQQPIPAGALVIEYVGEVIDKKTFQERMIANAMNKEENYYMFQLNRNLIIDAMYIGNNPGSLITVVTQTAQRKFGRLQMAKYALR